MIRVLILLFLLATSTRAQDILVPPTQEDDDRLYRQAQKVTVAWNKYHTLWIHRLNLVPVRVDDKAYQRVVRQEDEAWKAFVEALDELKRVKRSTRR